MLQTPPMLANSTGKIAYSRWFELAPPEGFAVVDRF